VSDTHTAEASIAQRATTLFKFNIKNKLYYSVREIKERLNKPFLYTTAHNPYQFLIRKPVLTFDSETQELVAAEGACEMQLLEKRHHVKQSLHTQSMYVELLRELFVRGEGRCTIYFMWRKRSQNGTLIAVLGSQGTS
jgi:hypothetical protein